MAVRRLFTAVYKTYKEIIAQKIGKNGCKYSDNRRCSSFLRLLFFRKLFLFINSFLSCMNVVLSRSYFVSFCVDCACEYCKYKQLYYTYQSRHFNLMLYLCVCSGFFYSFGGKTCQIIFHGASTTNNKEKK